MEMGTEMETGEKLRIYVGGLGSNVREDDLKKTFGTPHLGCVESVEIIRSKGRSFGYMDFIPASDKSLSKLFSSYNGCMWKGGKLKLEKAREHYLFRLKREWADDADEAELQTILANQNVDAHESIPTSYRAQDNLDIANKQIQLYFPKLRKIRPIPFKGTGKHKYSFQRVEIPPLPINFCDCEEHYVPPDLTKRTTFNNTQGMKTCNNTQELKTRNNTQELKTRNNTQEIETCNDTQEMETFGVNEEELNIMKSVLDKLLEDENIPNIDSNENEFTEEQDHFVTSVDSMLVANEEEEQVSDDDNLVINIVAHPNNKVAPTNDWGKKSTASYQDNRKMSGSEKRKLILERKRKAPIRGNDKNDHMSSKRNRIPQDPEVEMKPLSNPTLAPWSDKKDTQNNQYNKDEETEKNSEVQSPIDVQDKAARGAVQLKRPSLLKSAWLNKSSFSISQVLPGVAFEKQ